jgi:hypothetical protein
MGIIGIRFVHGLGNALNMHGNNLGYELGNRIGIVTGQGIRNAVGK